MVKKTLLTLLIILLFVAVAVYLLGPIGFNIAAQKAAPVLIGQLQQRGLKVRDYDFRSIRWSSPRTVSVFDLQSRFDFTMSNHQEYQAYFYAEKINMRLSSLSTPGVMLSCDNFQLYLEKADEIPGTSFGRFDHGYVQLRDPILLSDPYVGLRRVLQYVSDLFAEKEVQPNIILRSLVTLNVRDKTAQAYLYTVRNNDRVSLRFEEQDIRKMANTFELELSDEEVAIIARYPIRAPLVMRITSDAKDTSERAFRNDSTVPEDAYRHVLWSYLLTQKFDPEFAEQVTDAHETLPTNTADERKMDFHNNAVGREYAQRGVSRSRLLWYVRNDRQVIRYPHEVARFYGYN